LLIVGYALGILYMTLLGLLGSGPAFLLAIPALGAILIGFRSGLIMAVMSLLIYATFALAATLGWSQDWLIVSENSLEPSLWLSQGLLFASLLTALVVTQSVLSRAEASALARARPGLPGRSPDNSKGSAGGAGGSDASQAAAELDAVGDRHRTLTDDASRTANRLLAASRLSRDVLALFDTGPLLQRAVDSIAEQLGFDTVSVYLVSTSSAAEILLAATSGGQGTAPAGIAGRPSKTPPAVERVVAGGAEPETTGCELALPLEANGQILGALDVWAVDSTSFHATDAAILRLLADQLAVAIYGARLLAERQASSKETLQSREPLVSRQPQPVERRFGSQAVPDESWRSLFEQARATGAPATGLAGDGEHRHLLAVPVKLRAASIGVLGFHRRASAGPWRDDEITEIETVGNRLALAVDNARLLQGLQARASRERLVGEISARMRETLNVEAVLRSAAQEVRQALGLPEVVIRLAGPPDSAEQDRG